MEGYLWGNSFLKIKVTQVDTLERPPLYPSQGGVTDAPAFDGMCPAIDGGSESRFLDEESFLRQPIMEEQTRVLLPLEVCQAPD